MITQITSSQEGAEMLLEQLVKMPKNQLVVLLSGPLGVGKTSIIQSFAKLIGLENPLKSQSYGILKEYPVTSSKLPFETVLHGDLYRLDATAMQSLDVDFYLRRKSLAFLEWPEEFKKTNHWDLELQIDFVAGTAYDSPLRELWIRTQDDWTLGNL